ncbi:MAG TPA: hypothetical protein VFH31_12170, partial [Pyrinomonadaceae bacterium]|nr:hypothetical protein [Pyrinomonadaceae bacterium]
RQSATIGRFESPLNSGRSAIHAQRTINRMTRVIRGLRSSVATFLISGCSVSVPLTYTRLDLVPFDLGAILTAVSWIYWLLCASALAIALIKPRSGLGKVIATTVVAIVFAYLPVTLAVERERQKKQVQADRSELNDLMADFHAACDLSSGETVPDRPLSVKHLYVFDSTENVRGAWGFNIFDDYSGWIRIYKTDNDVSIVSEGSKVRSEEGNYLLIRSVIGPHSRGKFSFRGGRQELVEITTGEVKATRTNFFLGEDFARGVSCLDYNWADGFRSFVLRSVGFSPGFIRSDQWVKERPRLFLRGEVVSRRSTDENDFRSPIYPPNSKYDYNSRQLVIDGVGYYLSQRFNNEPLRVVGVHSFPKRMLVSYETDSRAPSVQFLIHEKTTAQSLQSVIVRIPAALHQDSNGKTHFRQWRIANDSVSFGDGRIRFDVVQFEETNSTTYGKFVRYTLEAPWQSENIESEALPAHLDDGHYGNFALQENGKAKPLTASDVIGQWISQPAGALWDFKEDRTIVLNGSKWRWSLVDGVVSAYYDHPNKDQAEFRASKDGKALEVTLSNRVGTYEPFIIRRIQAKN